jgi:hypothetical protein
MVGEDAREPMQESAEVLIVPGALGVLRLVRHELVDQHHRHGCA